MNYKFDPSIIRAYDIRGIFEQTLSGEDAYHIGLAFAAYLHKEGVGKTVSVARDGRLSSPQLSTKLLQGLVDGGLKVIDIGLVPTPTLYYAAYQDGVDAGIMITGSHNPANYNGFKMVVNKRPFYGAQLQQLETILGNYTPANRGGQVAKADYIDRYLEAILANVENKAKLKVVWDPGNGAVGAVLKQLVARLGGDHIIINGEVDGTFPAHHPDPTIAKNLEQLIAKVKQEEADFGIAFDGDGDRLAAVDSEGNIISGERLLTIFAMDLAKRHKDQVIICDVKTSDSILSILSNLGLKPMLWKTGHSNIKIKMKEIGCQLAGEMSGHIFFAENYYGFDDAILGAVKLFNLIAQSGQSLRELNKIFPSTFTTPEVKVKVLESEKFAIIERLREVLNSRQQSFNDLDGVRVSTAKGWWLVRASNTENCLTIRVESTDQHNFEELKLDVKTLLVEIGVDQPW